MSPMLEEMLVNEVVPRLRATAPSIPKTGHEDDEEIVQDSTLMGWFVLSILLPVVAIAMGAKAIITSEIEIRGTGVSGTTAVLYGAAFVAFGIASFGLPSWEAIAAGEASRGTAIRMSLGLAAFGVLILAATFSLF